MTKSDVAMFSCLPEGRRAGRYCPSDYRIAQDAFVREAEGCFDTVYVAGGVYGNVYALDALDELVAGERGSTLAVLNGDVHWFDYGAEDFAGIEKRLERYRPLVGNVEVELGREEDIGAGCGCSYPSCVSDDVVERSNEIHILLARMVQANSELKVRLTERAATTVCSVGPAKIAVTHGDEQMVGGWGCSRESLQDKARQEELNSWLRNNSVAILATTHTCAPAALRLANGVIINNGAAGMPNFKGQLSGLVTRISQVPSKRAVYSCRVNDVYVEAVPLCYNVEAFLAWFDALWPEGSPAAASYRERIAQGPNDAIQDALLGGFTLCEECAQD